MIETQQVPWDREQAAVIGRLDRDLTWLLNDSGIPLVPWYRDAVPSLLIHLRRYRSRMPVTAPDNGFWSSLMLDLEAASNDEDADWTFQGRVEGGRLIDYEVHRTRHPFVAIIAGSDTESGRDLAKRRLGT